MYKSMNYAGKAICPVNFCLDDSLVMKLIKVLVATMVSCEPPKRLSVDRVLDELKQIEKTGVIFSLLQCCLSEYLDIRYNINSMRSVSYHRI